MVIAVTQILSRCEFHIQQHVWSPQEGCEGQKMNAFIYLYKTGKQKFREGKLLLKTHVCHQTETDPSLKMLRWNPEELPQSSLGSLYCATSINRLGTGLLFFSVTSSDTLSYSIPFQCRNAAADLWNGFNSLLMGQRLDCLGRILLSSEQHESKSKGSRGLQRAETAELQPHNGNCEHQF